MNIQNVLESVTNSFEETPFEINNGACEDWTNLAMERLGYPVYGGSPSIAVASGEIKIARWDTLFEADAIHVFLQIDGKFYDAECLDGVADYMDLPIFKKLKRRQPIAFIDGNFTPPPETIKLWYSS